MGSIFGIILQALFSGLSGLANYFTTKKTNETNLQQYNDWKEYNTPANQMQRLNDAGLNPYLVSNVGNTLSQPFQIGVNNGIAESLNGLANSVAQGAQFAQNHYENELNRDVQRQNLEVKKSQLELNQLALNIKEKLARNAWRIGDARMALLWSQGRGQDILNLFNRSAMPYRLQGLYLGNYAREQDILHNAEMYPKIEALYEPAQRAKINNLYASSSHYRFMDEFMREKFNREMNLRMGYFGLAQDKFGLSRDLGWARYNQAQDFFNQRLGLSRDYFRLAGKKFRWNNALNWYKAFQADRQAALDMIDNLPIY